MRTDVDLSTTPETIEESFRWLVGTTRYRSITVKDICEDAGISRKTFYVHFSGKDAIVVEIFSRDIVNPVLALSSMLSNDEVLAMGKAIHERVFEAIKRDGDYYAALVAPMRGSDPTFLQIATRAFQDMYERALGRVDAGFPEMECQYVTYYYGSALAHLVERWICDGYKLPASRLTSLYASMAMPFWTILVDGRPRNAL